MMLLIYLLCIPTSTYIMYRVIKFMSEGFEVSLLNLVVASLFVLLPFVNLVVTLTGIFHCLVVKLDSIKFKIK